VTQQTARLARLERARTDQEQTGRLRPGVDALQALRGVQCTGTVRTVAALGALTRFDNPRQETQPRCDATLDGVQRLLETRVPRARPAPDRRTEGGHQPTDSSRRDRRLVLAPALQMDEIQQDKNPQKHRFDDNVELACRHGRTPHLKNQLMLWQRRRDQEAERQVSAAAGSGSDAGAYAGSGRLETLVSCRGLQY